MVHNEARINFSILNGQRPSFAQALNHEVFFSSLICFGKDQWWYPSLLPSCVMDVANFCLKDLQFCSGCGTKMPLAVMVRQHSASSSDRASTLVVPTGHNRPMIAISVMGISALLAACRWRKHQNLYTLNNLKGRQK